MIKANDIDINFTELIKDLDSIKEKLETVIDGVKDFREDDNDLFVKQVKEGIKFFSGFPNTIGISEVEEVEEVIDVTEFTLRNKSTGFIATYAYRSLLMSNRIVLSCRKEYQLESLLWKLSELGYTWLSGDPANNRDSYISLYETFKEDTIVYLSREKTLTIGSLCNLTGSHSIFEYLLNEDDILEEEVKEVNTPKTLCEFINSLGDMKVSAKWEDKLVVKCKYDDLLDYLCNYELEPTCCEIEFDSDLKLEYETEEFKLVGVK